MITAKSVFESLQGRLFTYAELRQAVKDALRDNIENIPAELGPSDLFRVASDNGWIIPDMGKYRIRVTKEGALH